MLYDDSILQYALRAGTVLTATKFATAQRGSSVMPCQGHACVLKEEPAGVATGVSTVFSWNALIRRYFQHV